MESLTQSSMFVSAAVAGVVLTVGLFFGFRALKRSAIRKREQAFSDAWLQQLLPVLEAEHPLSSLPVPGSPEQMSVAIQLILDLVERVRGMYRDRLCAVLEHIGARDAAVRDLVAEDPETRTRACRVLALAKADADVDLQLSRALHDGDWKVRLEAAYALAMRQPLGLALESLLAPLRTSDAFVTETARKAVQQFARIPGKGEELAQALMGSRNPQERVILLAGIAHADDLMLGDVVAWQLSDYSPAVRMEAVQTLERMADPVQIPKVMGLVSDPEAGVRLAVAAYATAMGGGSAAQMALMTLVKDSDPAVKRAAETGLRRWEGPAAGAPH